MGYNENNGELGWDDEIEKDTGFVELPEGDYDFMVDHWERGRSKGEGKLPPCNMATVYFNIVTPDNSDAQIRENFILHQKLEWKISELFRSVGLKKEGERVRMQWDKLPGLTGRCQVTLDPDRNDPSKKYNHIKKFYPKELKSWK